MSDFSALIPQAYSWLRGMSGGKLEQSQVIAGDKVINVLGFPVFANLIGFNYLTTVTGQFDISEKGYAIIKEFEGLRLDAYLDTGGVWTIGYGTIKYPSGTRVAKGDRISQSDAESYLRSDSKWVDACLDSKVKVKVNQNQFDALASFVYNIGESQFGSSTLLRKLNAGDFTGAANEFDKWVFDNGKKIQGLVNRRAKEKSLFLTK